MRFLKKPNNWLIFGKCTPFDILVHRAKSCKWMFPESIFSFKDGVGIVHCEGEEDESDCPQDTSRECNFTNHCNCNYGEGRNCDKSYRHPNGGSCESEDDLMCTARDGSWAGYKVCLGKKFHCDNHLQCEDGADEEDGEEYYLRNKIFTKNNRYTCKSPFLVVKTKKNQTGKFSPLRAVRSSFFTIIFIIIIIP